MEVFKNILSIQEAYTLSTAIENKIFSSPYKEHTEYCLAYGGNVAETDAYIKRIETKVKEICKRDINYSNSFSRVYVNGSFLNIHTDRPGLDITVSLCVRKDAKEDWPLCVSKTSLVSHMSLWNNEQDHSNFKQNFIPINLEPGDAGFVYGTLQPHWRDKLICGPNEKNIYVFYHWTFV